MDITNTLGLLKNGTLPSTKISYTGTERIVVSKQNVELSKGS